MNILQKITAGLMSPNEMLTSMLTFPGAIIEIILYVNILFTLLSIKSSKRKKYLQILILSLIAATSKYLLPNPFGTLLNVLSILLSFILLYKTKLIETFIGIVFLLLIATLFEMISTQTYTLIFEIPYSEYANYPLYTLVFLLVVYLCLFVMYKLFKKFNINITLFKNLNKKDTITIFITLILGFITVFLQLYISTLYNNLLPNFVILLSMVCLIAYFFVSAFNIVKTKQLEIANRDIKNLKLYNNTLRVLYDNIRAFKHDFNNIMNGIGGYITAKDLDGLSKYYKSVFKECDNLNNLAALNPETINNPSIYAILADKYTKANAKNIKIELGVFLDLNSLNIDTYELTRILGILLDNSIEAAQECEKKYISVRFLMDYRKNRQLVIVENTYKDKDIDTYKIFEKSYSTKPHNTGLGLWEVNKILKKHDNLAIYTSKDDELFKQQLEIYL